MIKRFTAVIEREGDGSVEEIRIETLQSIIRQTGLPKDIFEV